jgi:DNA-binding response OmpR family regulator
MSHELRTPLNSILVLSQLLSERESSKPLSQKEKEFAETIYSSGSDLLMLINDVLDLSKVEAGHLDIHLENFKLSRLIKDSISMFKPMTDVKAIEFHTYLDKSLPEEIKSDYLRIQQIIKNLVSNSIKFTENGNVSLTVRKPTPFEADTIACDTENYIAIDVSDTGIGIPEDKKQIIFEAFRQSDGTTSRKYGGTGLGLTISRELSSMLKGTMGKGSKFVFILPTNINQPLTNTVTSMKQQDITNEIPKIAKIDLVIEEFEEVSDENLLLIIEDDKTFSNILVDLSVEKGFSCIAAYTGAEGINLARSRKPSAVVLDLGLPDMDGMEVVKQLGKLNIPIHIISGTDQNANLPNSVIGYLKKPVDIKTIYKTLATIESLSKNTEKKLLIIGPCNGEDFEQFSSLGHMSVEKVITFDEGHDKIKSSDYDCLVIDYGLKDENGHSLIGDYLDDIKDTPTILYSEHELSSETLNELHEYTDSIILKSSKSEERLIDEVTLFLHGMKNAMNQTVHTTNQYKTVILDELSDKIKSEDSFEGKKVLIVDDDERNVYALSNVLFKHGFEVAVAHDGLESIRKVQSDTYDLVLMDIMMPKMDGYDAIKGIRNIHAAKHIPIIALTAKAMKEDRIKCIEAGANDYLTKPIDIEKLLSMMKVWLA